MVTLPEINQYSGEEIEALKKFSPVYEPYCRHAQQAPKDFNEEIRILKHQHWIKCSLASFTNRVSTEEICLYWSHHTDEIIKKAWNHFGLHEFEVSLLSFGKLGSKELNLSSDIDLVFIAENKAPTEKISPIVKKFMQCLSQPTSLGFAYRVDLNLRPGGTHSTILPIKSQFFNYYDEYLEAWNRVSFIRLRPIIGFNSLSEEAVQYCSRHSYPRRLDFSILNQIKSIRSKIKNQWSQSNEQLDIKLCPGGIRDIELLVQSLQVIYGGKEHQLQTASITKAIQTLSKLKIIAEPDADFLMQFYWQLRHIENIIHIKEDQHTYLLKDHFFKKPTPLLETKEQVTEKLKVSNKVVSDFFEESNENSKNHSSPSDISQKSKEIITELKNLHTPTLKKHKLDKIKTEILDQFISKTSTISFDQDLAIQNFKEFILSIKSKSSIFHLLHRHEQLVNDLAWLFSISPYIGRLLSLRPELIDSFVLGQVDINPDEDFEYFLENLGDYKLLGQLFAIIDLFKTKDINQFCTHLTKTADFIVSNLKDYVSTNNLKGVDLDILCLGKWSSFELGIQSDLDLIFLSDSSTTQNQIKLARRIINNITNPSKVGKLYSIDLRLKPNESSGPLIIEETQLKDFLEKKAEAWQKQAYLRSRKLNKNDGFFKELFKNLSINHSETVELQNIHNRLIKQNTKESIDLKNGPGGIIQTEFKIQLLCLKQTNVPKSSMTSDILDVLNIDNHLKLKISKNYKQLRLLEQSLQICNDSPSTKVSKNNSTLPRIGHFLGIDNVFEYTQELTNEQTELLKELDLNN